MVYGDRDLACNWVGGERVSIALNYTGFTNAGYQDIQVLNEQDSSYKVGGQVRQHANLSFSRIYQAGHEVPAYQPATAYSVFMRAMSHLDIHSGTIAVTDEYSTTGPSSTWHIKNEVKDTDLKEQCNVLMHEFTCKEETWQTVLNGTALIKDWIVVGREEPDGGEEAWNEHRDVGQAPLGFSADEEL